jgi:hypothetical protein
MMREHLGFETTDICKELSVTPTHCCTARASRCACAWK